MNADFPYELTERFEPIREISGGDKNIVYEALDKNLDRTFAVKVSRAGDAIVCGGLARLKREVDAIVQLRSPHVVPIYDLVELIDERVALVMEMVEGKTLSETVRDGALNPSESIVILHQLANALADMHMRGLVHRNISPSGLMLQRLPNGEVFLRLLDFGRVMFKGETPVRAPISDPRYAAPEELEPGATISAATDVFSAGAVAYHALSGQPPWPGETPERVISARQFPLQSLAQLCPELDGYKGLGELIEDMLTPDSSERMTSIQEVVEVARDLMKRAHLVGDSKPSQTIMSAPPAFAQLGLDADSSSVVWVDDMQRVHVDAMISELEIDAEITEICAKHGVIIGDEKGRVWGSWPDVETVYTCPDESPVTAIDAIEDLEVIAVGTLSGHVYTGRKRRDTWAWTEKPRGEGVDRLALSPDGSLLAVARQTHGLEVVDGGAANRLDLPTKRVQSLSWSRDNSILVVLLEGELMVYDRRGVLVYSKTMDPALIRLEYDMENELTALWVSDDGVETRPFSIDLG